jgi:SAM-dependent methyltransferase
MSEKYVMLDKIPERLRALQEAVDPATFRRIKALKIASGWNCWEVGAGGGSVAFWLSKEVGDKGKVLATDINLDLMRGLRRSPNVTLLKHDIDKDETPAGSFDLIHTRVVLMHGGINRAEVVRKLISALKPGGWLMLEEHDKYGTFTLMSENLAFAKALYMLTKAVESNGGSLSWARTLPTLLQDARLMDVGAEIEAPFFRGGEPYARFWGHSFQELRDQIVNQGMESEEVDLAVSQANDSKLWLSCHAMIAAWGRKPPGKTKSPSEGTANA